MKTQREIEIEVLSIVTHALMGEEVHDKNVEKIVEQCTALVMVERATECVHPYWAVHRKMDFERCLKCGEILCEG